MPVLDKTPYIAYVGNGATSYTYNFRVFKDTDLVVSVAGVVKTLATDYTVTGVGDDNGGEVVFIVPPAAGSTIEIERILPFARETDYQYGGAFREQTVDADQDYQTMLLQQLKTVADRSVLVPKGQPGETIDIIEYANRAGKVLGWNSLGRLAAMAMNFVTSSGALANPWADVRGYASLADAVAQLGGLAIDLYIPNIQVVTDNLAVPANIRLVIPMGGAINIAAGKTLTVYGTLFAGLYQIFTGDGLVDLTKGRTPATFPEWFGAQGDWNGTTGSDDTLPAQRAFYSHRTVRFLRRGYKFTDEVLLNPSAMGGIGGWRVLGGGNANGVSAGTYLYQATAGKAVFKVGDVSGLVYDQQSYFADLGFTGVSTAIGLWLAITEDTVIERCKFSALQRGIQLSINANTQVVKPRIYNCRFQALDYGIINFGTRIADIWFEQNIFQDNRIADIHVTGELDGGFIVRNVFGQYDTSATPSSKWMYAQIPAWLNIEHNHFYNCARTGAELTNPRHCKVARNQFYRAAQQNRSDVALKISSNGTGVIGFDNIYEHNIFYDCYGQAFLIAENADTDPQIVGNKSYGCGKGLAGAGRIYDAFVFNGLTRARVEDNFTDGKEYGLYVTVSTTAGSAAATLVSQTGGTLTTGMAITGKGIQPNTTVTVSGSSITLSKPATLSVTNQVMSAGNIVTRYGISMTQTTDCEMRNNITNNCVNTFNYFSGNRRLSGHNNQQPVVYTTTATANADDEVIYVTAASPWTLTIPSATLFLNKEYLIQKTDNNANLVTLSATINGAASYTGLNAQHKYVRIKSDGTEWRIVGAG